MLHLIHNSGYLDKVYDTVYIRGHMQREAAYRSLGFEEKYSLNWLTGSLAPCLLGTMTGLQKKRLSPCHAHAAVGAQQAFKLKG